jgi:hypothetical protein
MMTRTSPSRTGVRHVGRLAVAFSAVLVVAACSETGEFTFGSRAADPEGPAPIGATPLIERDVEAPDVFDVTEDGLWDGRPSLGGVWVAHPEATDPERVIIRNVETGSFVIGALFRRERENPGPVIQVSSDAAAALDVLAGDPTRLQVTALRREEVPESTQAPATDPAAVADTGTAPDAAPAGGEIAAAPLPEVADAAPASAPSTAPNAGTDGDGAAAQVDVAAAPEPAREGPRPLGFLSRIFAPAAPAAAVPAAQTALTAEEVAQGISSRAFRTETLDPVAAMAEGAIAESETRVAAVVPQAPRPSDLERPFVQIGIFDMQENARSTGEALRSAGLLPTIYDQTSNGRRFWRVVVGPSPTAEDRAAVLETVRGLGFEDAYFTTR